MLTLSPKLVQKRNIIAPLKFKRSHEHNVCEKANRRVSETDGHTDRQALRTDRKILQGSPKTTTRPLDWETNKLKRHVPIWDHGGSSAGHRFYGTQHHSLESWCSTMFAQHFGCWKHKSVSSVTFSSFLFFNLYAGLNTLTNMLSPSLTTDSLSLSHIHSYTFSLSLTHTAHTPSDTHVYMIYTRTLILTVTTLFRVLALKHPTPTPKKECFFSPFLFYSPERIIIKTLCTAQFLK